MAIVESQYDLTTVARVKQHMGWDGGNESDEEIAKVIKEVTSRIERFCARHFISRTWTHNGTVLPRLPSHGGSRLWLPEAPVTAVATLKPYPSATVLTEGWDRDFVVHAREGIVELLGGGEWWDLPGVVEITYTAGYLPVPGAGQEAWYGLVEAAGEIVEKATAQVAWDFRVKAPDRMGVVSRSVEGVNVAYMTDTWLPDVREVLETFRRTAAIWG